MDGTFVRTWMECDKVGSTSDLAREILLSQGFEHRPLPLLILAERQVQGRGRGTNLWYSDEGSLTFTLALDPAGHGLRTDHLPRIALAAAVAIVDAFQHLAPTLGIRWPNDVEIGGKKLAGILPEQVVTDRGPRYLIGIGLNVRTNFANAPPEVRRMATSLSEVTGAASFDTPSALRAVLACLERIIPRLASDDPELASRWRDLDHLRGEPIEVDLGQEVIRGVGAGIDADGALLLEAGSGYRRIFGGRVLRPA